MSSHVALFDLPGPRARRMNRILTGIGLLVVLAVVALIARKMGDAGQLDPAMWVVFLHSEAWVSYLVPGLIGTLMATVFSVLLAGVFGVLFGAGRLSHNAWIRRLSGLVVEFFRAVPVLIMMFFFKYLLVWGRWFDNALNPLIAVILALTLYNGSVIAELVRSGVHALPAGQHEAGLSLGLTRGQTLRLVQLPQSLVAMLPALIAQFVVVLKDSALGVAITYQELVFWSKTLGSAYANVVPAYIVAAALFIALNYAVTRLADWVEQRLRRTGHTAGPITNAEPNVIQGTGEPGLSTANAFDDVRERLTDGHLPKD